MYDGYNETKRRKNIKIMKIHTLQDEKTTVIYLQFQMNQQQQQLMMMMI